MSKSQLEPKSSEPNKYEINTFDQLLNVATEENLQNLVVDFHGFLFHYLQMINEVRKQHPAETGGLTNTEIGRGSFVWVDDGKNDVLGITVKDPSTGQIHHSEPTQP